MRGLDVPRFVLRPKRSCLFRAGFNVCWAYQASHPPAASIITHDGLTWYRENPDFDRRKALELPVIVAND
jgi:hypothetical protein